jgi:hypothetical protein
MISKTETVVPFKHKEFAQRCSLATILAFDDFAAWRTSDSIIAEKKHRLDSLDDTWFVQAGETRRVFYGRFFPEADTYSAKYAFEVENDSSVRRIPETIDSSTLDLAQAVYTGSERFKSILDSFMLDFKFNHYIRRNDDRTFSMWFFPAGVNNFCAYGLSIFLTIDTSGIDILNVVITGNELKYFEIQKVPSSIELDNTFDDVPSVGNIFFMIIYGKHFQQITIKNRNSKSTAVLSPDSAALQWTHTMQ